MRDISFSNPFLLLAVIPLVLVIVIPFLLAIRKENRTKNAVVSVVLHVLIIAFVMLSVAGTILTTVMTETNVYVVADVSYSGHKNLDKIDGYIVSLGENLPKNSKMGLVCFGKDYRLVTEMGNEMASVTSSGVDDSATNITEALEYTATLFEKDVIKRIVLITDGKQTDSEGTAELIACIESLHAQHIYIDAIFLDNNLSENAKEVQVSGVDYTQSTYLNHENEATVLLQSSYDGRATVTLYQNGEKLEAKAVTLTKGYNVTKPFLLPSDASGEYDYLVKVEAEEDESLFNNSYAFTQAVHGNINVLLITSSQDDVAAAEKLFGEDATIDSYVNQSKVPFTVEELCKYDEILISGVDVRDLENYTMFIDSLEKVVSLFGKSLTTIGDNKIQNKTDDVLKQLEDMLPVRYGNGDGDPKLYCLVIDASRSMQNASHLIMAKQAAIQILNLLKDNDRVMVISFSGSVTIRLNPTDAADRQKIAETINSIPPTQGTFLGAALNAALEQMKDYAYADKQLMLISDGMSYTAESDVPAQIANDLLRHNIFTSVINTDSVDGVGTLKAIANAGKGSYYYLERPEDVEDLILSQVADELTDTVIDIPSPVVINRKNDPTVKGIGSFGSIGGYVYARTKSSAVTVLSTVFEKKSGAETKPPLYAYWKYGNGKVSTFTGTLSGAWSELFYADGGEKFFTNMVETNIPDEKIDSPFTLDVTYDGTHSSVEIVPATLNPFATAVMTVTFPSGESVTEQLIFNAAGYFYEFLTPEIGKYKIHIVYSYDEHSYESDAFFNISYSPEYNSFVTFDASSLQEVIRNRGTVSEDGKLVLENDEKEVATYKIDLTVPFLIIAIVLFVLDIIVRKIKWSDIRSLFKKMS